MKKRFLIISLVVGLFLVMSAGVAMADFIDFNDNAADSIGDEVTFENKVIIVPKISDTIDQKATLIIVQPEANNPYENDNDATPLLMEGGNNLNTVSVIRSWGYKDGGTTEPTEAELRFDYGYITYDPANPDLSYMNAAIYTQGNDHILRLKPLEPGTGQILQEIQIEGENLGDTILRIAAKGDSEAALTFAKDSQGSHKDAIDTASIYRPANSDELRIEMFGDYSGGLVRDFYDIMTFKADYPSVAIGYGATADGWSIAMGYEATANGYASTAMGALTTSGNYSTAMGYRTTANGYFSTAMGREITVSGDSSFGIGLDYSTSRDSTITQDNTMAIMGGDVGIGTVSPSYKLQVGEVGDGTEARANAWNSLSDISLKTNLVKISDAVDKVTQINGYYFNWENGIDTGRHVGVIAQEVQKVLPEIISEDSEGIKSLDYGKLIPLLIEAIKEQQKEIEELRLEVEQLKTGG